jgi:hypothetical protein
MSGSVFDVYFGPVWLGRFIEAKLRIFYNLGRAKRRKVETLKDGKL